MYVGFLLRSLCRPRRRIFEESCISPDGPQKFRHNKSMKLLGLRLDTNHFEDYLSFLTEVLELELAHLDETSMHLQLPGNWLEIRKVACAPQHKNLFIRFALDPDEYQSLVNKISFFYYRKGQTSFQVESLDSKICSLIDPDGRSWCFSHGPTLTVQDTVANL
jgi:hypothetical protein